MATREEIFKRFGPQMFEAFGEMVKDEINTLRAVAGLSPRTKQQIMDTLSNKLDNTPKYDWMDD